MAEKLICPSCAASLTLKNPVAPGKAIRCPKCQKTFKPEAEKPVAAAPRKAAPTAPPSRKAEASKPERRERDDRDRDDRRRDGDEPPRDRSKRRDEDGKPAKKSAVLLWSLIGVGVLVLGGGTVGVLWGLGVFDKPKPITGGPGTGNKQVDPKKYRELIVGKWETTDENRAEEWEFDGRGIVVIRGKNGMGGGFYKFEDDTTVAFDVAPAVGPKIKTRPQVQVSKEELALTHEGGRVEKFRPSTGKFANAKPDKPSFDSIEDILKSAPNTILVKKSFTLDDLEYEIQLPEDALVVETVLGIDIHQGEKVGLAIRSGAFDMAHERKESVAFRHPLVTSDFLLTQIMDPPNPTYRFRLNREAPPLTLAVEFRGKQLLDGYHGDIRSVALMLKCALTIAPKDPVRVATFASPDEAMDALVQCVAELEVTGFRGIMSGDQDAYLEFLKKCRFLSDSKDAENGHPPQLVGQVYLEDLKINWLSCGARRFPVRMVNDQTAVIVVQEPGGNDDKDRDWFKRFEFRKKDSKWSLARYTWSQWPKLPPEERNAAPAAKRVFPPDVKIIPIDYAGTDILSVPKSLEDAKKILKTAGVEIEIGENGKITGYREKGFGLHPRQARALLPFASPTLGGFRISAMNHAEPFLDSDFAFFAPIKDTRQLTVFAGQFTDKGLKHLENLTQMEELMLQCWYASDSGFESFGKMKRLDFLSVEGPFTDAALPHLKPCGKLEALLIQHANIRGPGLVHIKELPNLGRLELKDNPLTGEGFEHLAAFPALESLDFDRCGLKDDALKPLGNIKGLRGLGLAHNSIAGKELACLKDLKNLKHLNLADNPLDESALEALAELKQLESLTITRNPKWSEQSVEKLQTAIKGLKLIEDAP